MEGQGELVRLFINVVVSQNSVLNPHFVGLFSNGLDVDHEKEKLCLLDRNIALTVLAAWRDIRGSGSTKEVALGVVHGDIDLDFLLAGVLVAKTKSRLISVPVKVATSVRCWAVSLHSLGGTQEEGGTCNDQNKGGHLQYEVLGGGALGLRRITLEIQEVFGAINH